MSNLYMTTTKEEKLNIVFTNIKKFYIFNVPEFIKSLNVDMSVTSNIYYINTEIEKVIISNLNLKKYIGVIYVHDNITSTLIDGMRKKFISTHLANRLIYIDDAWFPTNIELHSYFDEILFYERFKKMKIIDNDMFDTQTDDSDEKVDQ